MKEQDVQDPLVGQILDGRYEIVAQLGAGAMGAAYQGRHLALKRTVAIKVLHRHLLADPVMRQRFEREAVLAGRLRHRNLAGVIDTGETESGQHYIVMEFADGHALADSMVGRPMPMKRVHALLTQLCDGLDHAHKLGLVHRDLKPENIIVGRDDHDEEVPRIVDFGIAIGDPSHTPQTAQSTTESGRLTAIGIVLGTPHYMAPEQAAGMPLDARCDIFALGVVAYEMISGVLPFDGDGVDVARANLMFDAPPMAERVSHSNIDPLLDAFARKLMSRDREARPPTARAARELLDLIVTDREAAMRALGVIVTQAIVPFLRPPAIPAPRVAPPPPPPPPPPAPEEPAAPPVRPSPLPRATARPSGTTDPMQRVHAPGTIGFTILAVALLALLAASAIWAIL